jgi:hypothetical protein
VQRAEATSTYPSASEEEEEEGGGAEHIDQDPRSVGVG